MADRRWENKGRGPSQIAVTEGSQHSGSLELPFKPFSADEVTAITGVGSVILDALVKLAPLQLYHGSGETGLEWMQVFAVFVASRWKHEGADQERILNVLRYVCTLTPKYMVEEFEAGHSFPALKCVYPELQMPGIGMLVSPPSGVLGIRLRLDKLYREFLARVEKVFPRG